MKPTPRAATTATAPELLSTARSDISKADVITVEPKGGSLRAVAPAVRSKVPSADSTAALPVTRHAQRPSASAKKASSKSGKDDAKATKKAAQFRRMAAKLREASKAGTVSLGVAIRSIPSRIAGMTAEQRRRIATVAAAAVIVLAALYVPLRNYYTAVRDEQVLSAELDQVSSDNESLQSSIETLQTREGIEDEARRRGYVSEGETAVTVEGLSDSSSEEDAVSLTDDTAQTGDEPWYVRVGDFLFGYDPSQA